MLRDLEKILSEVVTLKDYDYVLKLLCRNVLEELHIFVVYETNYKNIDLPSFPCFYKITNLRVKIQKEITKKELYYSCNKPHDSIEDHKVLDEETVFRNLMSFYGSVAYNKNKYSREPFKMWYHIIKSMPVGPHYCPFYVNENLPNVCRGVPCNSISNLCNHPEGKSLEFNFWVKEFRELAGLLYQEFNK